MPTTLTVDIVRNLREAKRISRKDFESWEWNEDAAKRVLGAYAHYRHYLRVTSINDPHKANQ